MNDIKKKLEELENRVERLESLLREMVEKQNGEIEADDTSHLLARFDFSEEDCRNNSGWRIYNAEQNNSNDSLSFESIKVERTLGFFCDPMIINRNLNMPIDDIKYVHVRLKSNVDASQRCILRVYFTTSKYPEWSQSKSIDCYYPAGRKFDVLVETKNRFWNGMLTSLRIDPVEGLKGSIELELIELLDKNKEVKYSFDFTNIDNFENIEWKLRNTTFVSSAGKLLFNIDVLEKKRIYTDPFIVIDNLELDATKAKYIHVKMRTDIEDKTNEEVYMQILFKTKNSNYWTQDKSMRFSYRTGEDIDAYIEIRQLFWKGTVVSLRIDPFESFEGKAKISLIEILSELPHHSDIEILEARTRHLEDRFNKIYN